MSTTRDEFEKWASDQPYQLNKIGDEYKYMATQHAWLGWQASREALCIEIPKCGEASSFGNWVVFDTESVQEMLSSVGVRYK